MHGKCQIPQLSVFNRESTSEWPLSERSSWVGVFLCFINDLSFNVLFSLDMDLPRGSIWHYPAFPSINPSPEFLATPLTL